MEGQSESDIEAACLSKFAFGSYGAALKVAKRYQERCGHKGPGKGRVVLHVYRCDYKVQDSSDRNRRRLHFHVGGNHDNFAASAF